MPPIDSIYKVEEIFKIWYSVCNLINAFEPLKSRATFTWKIGGEAGFGIKVSGTIFAKVCIRAGLHVFDYSEYPSLIRGGHNSYQITVSNEEVFAESHDIDYLIALNEETVELHKDELMEGACIVYDNDVFQLDESYYKGRNITLYHVPLKAIVKEIGAVDVVRNTVTIGAMFALLCEDLSNVENELREMFERKGEAILNQNLEAVRKGYEFVKAHYGDRCRHVIDRKKNQPKRMVLTGNDAASLGAVAGSCKFFAAYPMTPATSVLHSLAKWDQQIGMVVKQAEDEISVINMALGASFAGVRSMVCTSGGGFALMIESFGLAGITETPVVIFESMRPGPATGLPTWSGQGDLRFVVHAAPDDFPRVVLTPGDVDEAFHLTRDAFNLAEKFQIPVIILSDKYLSESQKSTEPFSLDGYEIERGEILTEEDLKSIEQYKRYEITDSGISPRVFPGTPGGVHMCNGDEHDETGLVDETAENRHAMHEKRMRKFDAIKKSMPEQAMYGSKKADVTIISWGSTKGSVREAMKILDKEKVSVNFLHISHPFPFPELQVKKVMTAAKKTLLIEGNASAQFGGMIQQYVGRIPDETFLKYDGRPFFPSEIADKVKELL